MIKQTTNLLQEGDNLLDILINTISTLNKAKKNNADPAVINFIKQKIERLTKELEHLSLQFDKQ